MLYKVLDKMQERPGLYPCENVRDVFTFIQGYAENVSENDEDFEDFKGFQKFVISKYKNNVSHANWCTLIAFYTANGKESFNQFFELLKEYRKK